MAKWRDRHLDEVIAAAKKEWEKHDEIVAYKQGMWHIVEILEALKNKRI